MSRIPVWTVRYLNLFNIRVNSCGAAIWHSNEVIRQTVSTGVYYDVNGKERGSDVGEAASLPHHLPVADDTRPRVAVSLSRNAVELGLEGKVWPVAAKRTTFAACS